MANIFNWIRMLCLLLLSVNYIFILLFFKIQWFFFAFSNWTLFLTTVSVYVSMEASYNLEKFGKMALKKAKEEGEQAYSDKLWHHAWHHMLYSLSIISNVVMFCIYWPFLHRDAVEKMGKQPITGPYLVMHMYLVHLFPTVACLFNSLVTNCVLKRDIWKQILQSGIFYFAI